MESQYPKSESPSNAAEAAGATAQGAPARDCILRNVFVRERRGARLSPVGGVPIVAACRSVDVRSRARSRWRQRFAPVAPAARRTSPSHPTVAPSTGSMRVRRTPPVLRPRVPPRRSTCGAPWAAGASRGPCWSCKRLQTPAASSWCKREGSSAQSRRTALAPGHPEKSLVLLRMKALDQYRMPPLASHVVDQASVDVLTSWIGGLSPCP